MPPREAYDWLRAHSVDTARLETTVSLLSWDQGTYAPPLGHHHRAEQIATLTRIIHTRRTDPRRADAIHACLGLAREAGPDSDISANLRIWQREHERQSRIPEDLAVATARAAAQGESAWERLRPKNDWKGFLPYVEHLLRLRREEADAVGYEREPYDAMLDKYEPGETAASVAPLFDALQSASADLLGRIAQRGGTRSAEVVTRHFPPKEQERFARHVMTDMGFDFMGGRMDTTAHPFCTRIGPGDVRVTTRYRDNDFAEAFFGCVHECGHALYEQGLPGDHFGTPCGRSASLGIHESQSRLWENLVARSHGFWTHYLPFAAYAFEAFRSALLNKVYYAVNAVHPGCIRTDADELTYNMHIFLRFDLERRLMSGSLDVHELPDAFNEGMYALLGITPKDYASGVMQDVHWGAGLFGYFPTYALGNIYAAQFMDAARRELGDLEAMFARGDFAPLLGWLRTAIHTKGARLDPRDLVREVTGNAPDASALISHLEHKYTELYGLRPKRS